MGHARARTEYAIGVDIGGRNVKGVAVTAAGRVLAESRTPTGDLARTGWLENVRTAVRRLQRAAGGAASWIGVAAPGLPADDERSIAYMPGRFHGLEGLSWGEFLKAPKPVPVLNDAHAALLGEHWRGAARGARNALLFTLGTGVGGAAIVDGRLLRGHLGRAGHFGHLSLDPDGAPDIARTPGSLEDAIGDHSVATRSSGRFASTRDLVDAATRSDPAARQVWLDSVKALAAGIASLINALDPEVVVVGGGMIQAGPTLFRPLRQWVNRFEWQPGGRRVRIVAARLGDRAGAFGAAWHALQFHDNSR